jgi:hypothetical protein
MPVFIELIPEDGNMPLMVNADNIIEISEHVGNDTDSPKDYTLVTFKDCKQVIFKNSYVDIWDTMLDLNIISSKGSEI